MKTLLTAILLVVAAYAPAQVIVIFNQNNLSNDMVYKMVSANLQNSDAAGLRLYTINTNIVIHDDTEFPYSSGAYRDINDRIITNKASFWCLYNSLDVTGNPAASNTVLNTTAEWLPAGSSVYSRFKVTLNADLYSGDFNGIIRWPEDLAPPATAAVIFGPDANGDPTWEINSTNITSIAAFNGTTLETRITKLNMLNASFQTNALAVTPNVTLCITNLGKVFCWTVEDKTP